MKNFFCFSVAVIALFFIGVEIGRGLQPKSSTPICCDKISCSCGVDCHCDCCPGK